MIIVFDGYKHHIVNNFKKLLKEKNGLENTSVITTPILIKIEIHIGLTEFLDNNILNVMISLKKKI